MRSKILAAIVAGIVAMSLALIFANDDSIPEEKQKLAEELPKITIAIAMSSSRPGCETTGCYLPTIITINQHDTITWINEDRGLHTVTTGYYDTPDGMIESEQIAPAETFSFTFDDTGQFHYYCRLHPWMEGTVIVN